MTTYADKAKKRAARRRAHWWNNNRDDVILGGFVWVFCALIAFIPVLLACGY